MARISIEDLEARRLLSGSPSAVTAKLSHGTLKIVGTASADTIVVNETSGTLSVTSGGTSVYSASASGTKKIEVIGKNGDDNITVGSGIGINTVITDGNGADTISSDNSEPTTIMTGSGNDNITGGNGDFVVKPGSGTDSITLGNGLCLVYNGKGDDAVTVGNSSNEDVVLCGAGDDVSLGTAANLNVVASAKGADTINSSGKDDIALHPGNILNGNASDRIWLDGDSMSNLTGTTGATFHKRLANYGHAVQSEVHYEIKQINAP